MQFESDGRTRRRKTDERGGRSTPVRRRRFLETAATAGVATLAGCGVDPDNQGQAAAASLTLRSPALDPGTAIPREYTCDGADVSPPLRIDDVPAAAVSLALLVDDISTPTDQFTHWVAWNLPPTLTVVPRGIPTTPRPAALEGGVQGTNDFDDVGYGGPCPPAGDASHTYRFQVFALTERLELTPEAGGAALLAALDPILIATGGFTARYER
ncbi:MAG: YbhB/YbcL family Raf kinase inhibitor-like protein [Halobacteriaceae archaeon]